MNLFSSRASRRSEAAQLDQLRSRLEEEVSHPSAILLTSSSTDDGQEIVAEGLAHSFACAGYSTLFIDATESNKGGASFSDGVFSLEELALAMQPEGIPDEAVILNLHNPRLQRTSSKREIESFLQILSAKFDYVIISSEIGLKTSFAASFGSTAGAVLACVKGGRRRKREDTLLSSELERMGSRFIGIVTVDRSVLTSSARRITREIPSEKIGSESARGEIEKSYRGVAGYRA